jgi:hypothetical protein
LRSVQQLSLLADRHLINHCRDDRQGRDSLGGVFRSENSIFMAGLPIMFAVKGPMERLAC